MKIVDIHYKIILNINYYIECITAILLITLSIIKKFLINKPQVSA